MTQWSERIAAAGGAVVVGLVILLSLTGTPLRGDDWNLKTSFSVEQPIEVPGAILEPNTKYIIQVMEFPADRNVMRITNEDESKVITTFNSVDDNRRSDPVETPTFDFKEVAAGHPLPVRAWYYPGRPTGFEFLYPEDQEKRIAAYRDETAIKTNESAALNKPAEPVNAELEAQEQGQAPEQVQAPDREEAPPQEPALVAQVEPVNQDVADLANQPIEPEKAEAPTQLAKPTEPEPQSTTSQTRTEANEAGPAKLPATAGELPLLALLGALSLGLGIGVRAVGAVYDRPRSRH